MKVRWLLLLSVMVSHFAHAGGTAGNGGNAVVCYSDASKREVTSIQLFDYWEMSQMYPLPGGVSVQNPNASVDKILKELTDRISELDPEKAARFLDEALRISRNINFYFRDSVPTIDDDNAVYHPTSPCFKEQFAVQILNPTAVERRFAINKPLYLNPKNTNLQRAGIILHEVIYRYAMEVFHHIDSDGTRKLNYYIATQAMKTFQADQFEELLNLAKMPSGYTRLFVDSLKTVVYGTWGPTNVYHPNVFTVKRIAAVNKNQMNVMGPLFPGTVIQFNDNPYLVLEWIESPKETSFDVVGQAPILGKKITYGSYMRFIAVKSQKLIFGNDSYLCSGDLVLDVDDEFAVRRCTQVALPVTLPFGGGRVEKISALPGKTNFLDLSFRDGFVSGYNKNTDYPLSFKIPGTSQAAKVESVVLNEKGEMSRFVLTDDIQVLLLKKYKVTFSKDYWVFLDNEASMITAVKLETGKDLKVNGLTPILRNGNEDWLIGDLCHILTDELNPQKNSASHRESLKKTSSRTTPDNVAQKETVEVFGAKDFFDVGQNKKVTIVDDKVTTVKQVTCAKDQFHVPVKLLK